MSYYINRKLKNSEVVYPIKGDKTDNRIENLILFKNYSEHHKFRHYQTIGTTICDKCNHLINLKER